MGMINKHKVFIEDHLGSYEINDILKDYKVQLRLYKRVIFIKMLRENFTIKEATEFLKVSERTGYNWLKSYNEDGLDGLIPNFGGGRPSFLSDEQLKELYEILTPKDANYSIKDVQKLILEKFGIDYTHKQVWFITRKKLGLNYGKPSPESPERDPERKKVLKKKLEIVDFENDFIGFLDSSGVQNLPNTIRTLYEPGTKNTKVKNTKKYKLNATGFQGMNCSSILQFTENTRAHEFGKIITKIRLANTKSEDGQKLLNEALNNPNLTDKYVITSLKRKRDSAYEYREKINDKIYDEKTDYDSTNKNIMNYAKRQDPNNIDKKDEEKRNNLLKNLNTNEIKEIFANEPILHIVLDNYSVHHTPLIKDISKILNINLIYLPTKSPDLNPIEDVWRVAKKEVYNENIQNKNHLALVFEKAFYEEVDKKSYFENWKNEYLKISEKS